MLTIPDVTKWPEKWNWSFDKPVDWNAGRKGKKKYKYTVYISNGEAWLSPEEVYLFVDGDDLAETLQRAHDMLIDKVELKKATIKAGKGAQKDKKAYHVCKAGNTYFPIAVDKYNEKGMLDDIVQTIHPER